MSAYRLGRGMELDGGAFIERLQTHGHLETAITAGLPEKNLTFRNLGWSGDNVWGDSRGVFGFGVRAEGFKRLLGDVAIATNDFELFTDFGVQIKARSRAVQTFLVQLAGPGTYVPTERATRGGGYSAVAQSSVVGADGGQEIVERTVGVINALWSGR